MSKSSQKPQIAECKQSVHDILDQIRDIDDLDLWQEADGKPSDVLKVWRDAEKAKPEPNTFTFSDGETRNLTAMAASHAVAEMHPDLDQDDEFPAWMGRGEKGA